MRVIDAGSVRLSLDTEPDPEATPFECDCYSPEDLTNYRHGRWGYVTVWAQVTVGSERVVIGDDHLSSVEDGWRYDALDLSGAARDVAFTALDNARRWVTQNFGTDNAVSAALAELHSAVDAARG